MTETKENLLEEIDALKKARTENLIPRSRALELRSRYLILDILEYLLVADTARKLD